MDVDKITPELFIRYMNHIHIPEYDARAGWFVDGWTLLEALDQLKIKQDVHIKYASGRFRLGTHYNRINERGEFYHHIVMNQKASAYVANESLWHELAHAYQSERWAEKTGKTTMHFYDQAYKLAKGRHGESYESNLFEIHARAMAERYHELIKIIRETKR